MERGPPGSLTASTSSGGLRTTSQWRIQAGIWPSGVHPSLPLALSARLSRRRDKNKTAPNPAPPRRPFDENRLLRGLGGALPSAAPALLPLLEPPRPLLSPRRMRSRWEPLAFLASERRAAAVLRRQDRLARCRPARSPSPCRGKRGIGAWPQLPPRPLLPHAPPYPARRERRGGAKGSWLTAARDWQLFSLARQSVGWTKGPISGASGRVGGNTSWGSGMARQRSATSDWVHCQDEHALSPIGKASNLRDAPPQCGGWRCPERGGLGRLWGVGGCVMVRWGRGSGADPGGCRPPPGVLWERGGEVLGLWVRWLLSRRTPQAVEEPRGTVYISATGTCIKSYSRACSQLVELT